MAWGAWTHVELGQSVSVELELLQLPASGTRATIMHIGGIVYITYVESIISAPVHITPPPWWSPGEGYSGTLARLVIQLPGTPPRTTTIDVYERGAFWDPEHKPPTTLTWSDLPQTVTATWTITGIKLKSLYTGTPVRSDASVTHSTECGVEERWFADGSSTYEIQCAGLSYGGSFVPPLVPYGDGEIDMSDSVWRLNLGLIVLGRSSYSEPSTDTFIEFNNITLGDIPVDCSDCDQASNRTWVSERGWTTNDGGRYIARGSGASISFRYNHVNPGANVWSGWLDMPRAVNLSGVSVQKFLGGEYAEGGGYYYEGDAPLIHTGCLDINGNELVEPAGVLRGYGTIVSKDRYSWIAQTSSEVPPYVPWSGYNPPATVRLYLDSDWLQEHAEYHTDGTYDDTYITLDCHALSFSDRTEPDVFVNGILELAHVQSIDVNDPPTTAVRTVASRPSLWVGSGGVIVSSTPALNDLWEVQDGATAPVVSRELVSIYFDRLDAVRANMAGDYMANGFPECYLYDKANQDPKKPNEVDQTEEDVCSWMRYAYLRVGFNAPEVTLPATLTLTVLWYDVIITDNHLTGSERVDGFGYSRVARSASYSFVVSAPGSQYVDLDLLSTPTEQESVSMRHVYKLEFSGFPCEAGTWELETLELRRHTTDSFRHAKFVEPWTYTGVGWSMVVDGRVSALALPDNYRQNAEDGLEILNWLYGATSGLDLTTPFMLDQLANILNNQEGLTCELNTAQWDAHFLDDDSIYLCDQYPWLCAEDEDRDEDGATANWDWPIAVRANQITIPRGIVYRITATKILQCGGHGVAWSGIERYPSATVYIWRRQPGATAWDPVGTCEPNALGYYTMGELKVMMTQGASPPDGDVTWQYGVSLDDTGDSIVVLGIGFNREWMWQRTSGSTIYYPNICRDKEGQVWRVAADLAGRLYVAYLGADASEWTEVAQPFGGAVGYSWPSIAAFGDGSIIVAATSSGDMRLARSRDRGTTWTAMTLANLGDGLEYGDIAQRAGKLWLCGWDSDKVWLALSSNKDLQRDEIKPGTYLLEVGDAPSGDITPRSSVVQADDGSIVVVIGQADGTIETFMMRDPDVGFEELD